MTRLAEANSLKGLLPVFAEVRAEGLDLAIEAIRVREPIHPGACPCATCRDRRGIIQDLQRLLRQERG